MKHRAARKNKSPENDFRELLENISEGEFRKMMNELIEPAKRRRNYYRNLDVVESQAISTEAYGYMISMYTIGSLTEITFEKVIQICLHLYFLTQEQVNKNKLDKIITMINFSDVNQANIKEFIDTLITDNKYQMNTQKIKH